MLSKIIYKALMVFALAFFAQIGYSQNYVSSDVAIDRLDQAIEDIQANSPANSDEFRKQVSVNVAMDLKVMNKTVEELSKGGLTVAKLLTNIDLKAQSADDSIKVQLVGAVNRMKNLLLN